jgi:hypothetical protein
VAAHSLRILSWKVINQSDESKGGVKNGVSSPKSMSRKLEFRSKENKKTWKVANGKTFQVRAERQITAT